mgnify:CR=1 FL=1
MTIPQLNLLRSLCDYHRDKSKVHEHIAMSYSDVSSVNHHKARAALHESWRAEVEALIAGSSELP